MPDRKLWVAFCYDDVAKVYGPFRTQAEAFKWVSDATEPEKIRFGIVRLRRPEEVGPL